MSLPTRTLARLKQAALLVALIAAAGVLAAFPTVRLKVLTTLHLAGVEPAPKPKIVIAPPPAVTVVRVAEANFVADVLVTGTLVPREEVLVAPQVEGQRILSLDVEEGQTVVKGQVLARLVTENIDAQLAQNAAAIARTEAAIAQARSAIVQSEARLAEAQAQFDRAKPLKTNGYLSGSVFDQRDLAAKTAASQLTASRDGLRVAEADNAQSKAQRREIEWRRANTEIKAPRAGMVSRRSARVGGVASAAGEPMFRIIADGEIELDAQVPETQLAAIAEGQSAVATATGGTERTGRVRLVSPEIDRATRLGQVRISLGQIAGLKIGGFARARIITAERRGLAVPAAAVMYDDGAAYVLAVEGTTAVQRRVTLGISSTDQIEVVKGLEAGTLVVARAGTFLRNGDPLTPMLDGQKRVSSASPQTTGSLRTGAAE